VGSPSWSRAHALVEELNARAHAEAAEGKEELVPLALAAETETETEEGATRGARRKSPLAAVSAHLLAASAWRAKALPLVLRSLEEEESKKREEKESSSSFLGLYGLLRHDVSCANLLAVALSAPPPAPISTKASAAAAKASPTKNPTTPLSVSAPLPSAIRALCDDSATACALAAWAARSLRWWDAERGGRAAAARTAEAAAKKAATAKAKGKNSSCLSSPSLAADETALAAASSALAVFRCLAQHAEDLPPGVGEVLSGAGAGDLVPVLVRKNYFLKSFLSGFFFLLLFLSLVFLSFSFSLRVLKSRNNSSHCSTARPGSPRAEERKAEKRRSCWEEGAGSSNSKNKDKEKERKKIRSFCSRCRLRCRGSRCSSSASEPASAAPPFPNRPRPFVR